MGNYNKSKDDEMQKGESIQNILKQETANEFELVAIPKETKDIFNRLNEFYQYDFSEWYLDDINDEGLYGHYTYFDNYFTDPKRHAYYIKVEGKYAGFVLINDITLVSKEKDISVIAEFFILKKYRRNKMGTQIALKILNMFPGKWEFKVLNINVVAMKFLEKLVKNNFEKYTVTEVEDNGYTFTVYNFEIG